MNSRQLLNTLWVIALAIWVGVWIIELIQATNPSVVK